MCELPGGVAGDENGVARTRTPALLTCTDEEGGTSCRRKNWGDDLFRREKPLDVRAHSRPFFARARARAGTVYGPTKFPISTVQPNNTVAAEVWQRNTTFFHSSFVGKSRARWLSSRLPARAQTGLQLLVQFPVTTVHTCRLLRNVQQIHIQYIRIVVCSSHTYVHVHVCTVQCSSHITMYVHVSA